MHIKWSFPGGARGKESASQCRRYRRQVFDLWVGKIPRRKKWQPTPVSLPGESHGQRNLADYSPWGHRELGTTEQLKVKVKVIQLCPTLCDLMDYTVRGILQARILEWVAFPFSSRSSRPRNQTGVSCTAGGFFTN